jgi:hypothetical protein
MLGVFRLRLRHVHAVVRGVVLLAGVVTVAGSVSIIEVQDRGAAAEGECGTHEGTEEEDGSA